LDFTLHFVILPLQKQTSEWDEKTEESQILLSREIQALSIPNKADPMGKEITHPTWMQSHTSFINLAAISWRVFGYIIFKGPYFPTFSSKSH